MILKIPVTAVENQVTAVENQVFGERNQVSLAGNKVGKSLFRASNNVPERKRLSLIIIY